MENNSRKARFELFLIATIALILALLELYIDSFERLMIWAASNESLLVTEIVTLTIVLSIGLSIYAWRRWREAIRLEVEKADLQQSVMVEQDANRLMRSYADAMMRGQEAERQRLARELHDDTIQQLIVLNQKVELAAFDHAESSAAPDLIEMEDLISDTIADLRRFIQELRPTYLDELGLVPALNMLIKQMRNRYDVFIEFEVTGNPCRCGESIELALYRIVQSGLNNVVRHAEASSATVVLDFRPKSIVLSIDDDGKGFQHIDETKLVAEGHFGLIGMRERAELLGASYEINTRIGAGTQIRVVVPLE